MRQLRMVGFTGHAGLPPRTVELVVSELRSRLAPAAGPELVGISLLGPGADQLFAKIVLELGGHLYVVVCAKRYRDQFQDPEAQREYDRLHARATYFQELEYTDSTEEAHMAGGRAIVDNSDLLMAVWDGQPGRGHGGTAEVVAYAQERGVRVEVIWPEGASRD
jgi:hypothetical protein